MKTSLLLVSLGLLLNANAFKYMGTNQAGAEFGSSIPGTYNSDYTFPKTSSIDYFIANGMNTIRVPFLWERLQPQLNGAFNSAYLGYLDNTVKYVTETKGAYIVLDVHNYLLYRDVQIGQGVDYSAFQNFWQQLAGLYKSNPKVIFGLMNEPHDAPYVNVFKAMQAGINGIRASGATNAITVPGNDWTGVHSWLASAPYMGAITDPLNNLMFEMHQYFDNNYSGNGACVSTFDPATIFGPATTWLRANGNTGFLGEFGIEKSSQCLAVLDKTMAYLAANSDVWVGWTWWAAGPWWGASYKFSLEEGVGDAQLAVLKKYMIATSPVPQTPSTTGSNRPSTTGSRLPSTTGSRLPSTTASAPASPVTTGRVKVQTPVTTGLSRPSTTGKDSDDVPTSCTSGNMKCLTGNSYSTCTRGVWGAAQKCVTGTYCSPSGKFIYCLQGSAPNNSTNPVSSTSSTTAPAPTSTPVPVPASPASTSASAAPTPSSDSCTLGQSRCSSSSSYQTCGNSANGGFTWSVARNCQAGLSCHAYGNQVYCY